MSRARDPAFAGFWMGGFEGADHVNFAGQALDMVRASGHLDRLDEDHRRAAQLGLSCVRESIGWRLAEPAPGVFDFERALRIEASARRHGLQVLWTLMHYGLPADLSLHDDAMIPRLAAFAAAAARVLGRFDGARPLVLTPVNEIGFLAWAASQPGMLHPPNNHARVAGEPGEQGSRISGYAVKRRLARAAIAAMQAVQAQRPETRFLHVEPLVHAVAPLGRPDLAPLAQEISSWQWQAWDLLAGRIEPELGGRPEWLDLVGVNHYHSSQWEIHTEARLDWAARDPRRQPLRRLLEAAWRRYARPMLLAETSHVGAGRADWLDEVAGELRAALRAGIPVQGLCLYPLTDRPDWQDPRDWHRSGVWHVDETAASRGERPLPRHAEPEVQASLRAWQAVLPPPSGTEPDKPLLLAFSHRRWDALNTRTRQLLSRLAGHWRIAVVEEPWPIDARIGAPRLDCITVGPSIERLVPWSDVDAEGFDVLQRPLLQTLLGAWLAAQGLDRPTVWLTTPMAWPLARALSPRRVVYDCADELAEVPDAPPALATLEVELLGRADRVFTAGAALAVPRRALAGQRLALLPNGVELARFAPRRGGACGWDAHELSRLPLPPASEGPHIGYAGAIDERLDLPLVATLAELRPRWQFVFAGPIVRIDPAALPRAPNLHWLGALPYRLLPGLMAGWRLALLPFVHDALTRHANPLQAWEALAAGLPVVAPPLSELLDWRSAGVECVAGSVAVLQACEAALEEGAEQAARRRRVARRRLQPLDWRVIAAQAQRVLRGDAAADEGRAR